MIRQEIAIPEYGWNVWAYYAVDAYYTGEIAERLERMGCGGDYLSRAVTNMESRQLNHGLTYSNMATGESVVVVGLTSSADEFLNSLCHELYHLTQHICEARGIDHLTEEAAYLMGNVARGVYYKVAGLLCERCRKEKEVGNVHPQ